MNSIKHFVVGRAVHHVSKDRCSFTFKATLLGLLKPEDKATWQNRTVTRGHVREDLNVQQHRWEYLKPRNLTVNLATTEISKDFTNIFITEGTVGCLRVRFCIYIENT
jgi:hypothetical protein